MDKWMMSQCEEYKYKVSRSMGKDDKRRQLTERRLKDEYQETIILCGLICQWSFRETMELVIDMSHSLGILCHYKLAFELLSL